jgi:hypothetical protein
MRALKAFFISRRDGNAVTKSIQAEETEREICKAGKFQTVVRS